MGVYKSKILFSTYAGAPLFNYRVNVYKINDNRSLISLVNPPGLLLDSGVSVVITPIRENAVEGESVKLPLTKGGNFDYGINVVRSEEGAGFKAVYTLNNISLSTVVFYYPDDLNHNKYNINVIYGNIRSINPSIINTKDPELTIFATDISTGKNMGPELVIPIKNNCNAYNVTLDLNNYQLKVEMLGEGGHVICDRYIYIPT